MKVSGSNPEYHVQVRFERVSVARPFVNGVSVPTSKEVTMALKKAVGTPIDEGEDKKFKETSTG